MHARTLTVGLVSVLLVACSSSAPEGSTPDPAPGAAPAPAPTPSSPVAADAGPANSDAEAPAVDSESIAIANSCTRPTPPGPGAVSISQDLVYASPNGAPQMLDVFRPKTPGAHPLVVIIHGGGWTKGSKNGMRQFGTSLTSLGYVTATLNYRLAEDNGVNAFPAPVSDVRCAIRWLRANAATYGIDSKRIAAVGLSAGAHLAAMLGVGDGVTGLDDGTCPAELASQSAAVSGVVGYYTPTDFKDPTIWANNENQGAGVISMLGGPLGSAPAVAALASPITHVSAATPPFFLSHGTADAVVPVAQSDIFAAALKSAGGKATVVKLDGVPHGYGPLSDMYPTSSCTTLAFLAKYLAP